MDKYLITGFSGFVSRHFCEYLERNKLPALIKGIDIQQHNLNLEDFKYIKWDFEILDLLSKEGVENIVRKFQPDYVLHLASISSVAFSWQEPILSFQNNTNIFLNLLDAIKNSNKNTRILSIGSSDEYGQVSEKELPLTEEHNLNPVSPYAVARVSQELLSKIYAYGYGLDIVMTRSFNHIGPWQKDIFVISSFAKQLVQIKKEGRSKGTLTTGDVSIVRDFIDVRDVVNAYYLLLHSGKKGEIYNVCSGRGKTLKNVIDAMANILNIKVDVIIDKKLIRPNDNPQIIGSNKKIKTELGWDTQYHLDQSLADILNYWEDQL